MKLITGWHPFRTALIVCLPYLFACEALYFWYQSGSSSGFLIGGLLLAYLLMPSWHLYGRSAYHSIQEHAAPYLGCQSEPTLYNAQIGFTQVQAEIGITVSAIFLCLFLPTFLTYMLTRTYKRNA